MEPRHLDQARYDPMVGRATGDLVADRREDLARKRLLSSSDVLDLCPGLTYRVLDYWARTGVVCPTQEARGSGSWRGYSPAEAKVLRVLTIIRDAFPTGAPVEAMREMAAHLRSMAHRFEVDGGGELVFELAPSVTLTVHLPQRAEASAA